MRICFFSDPEGILLELVDGDLRYAQVLDGRSATDACYAQLGYSFLGTIGQPHDPPGFGIVCLKSGATVLEVFTYDAEKQSRASQPDAPGFGWAEIADTLFDALEDLRPAREHWLDFQRP